MVHMSSKINVRLESSLTKPQALFSDPLNQKGVLKIFDNSTTTNTLPANILFILDCSGSMSGHPMDLLNSAIDIVSGKLRDEDMLSIIAFGSSASIIIQNQKKDDLYDNGVPHLVDMGGTNYNDAFSEAIEFIKGNSQTMGFSTNNVHLQAKIALFFSDGAPTCDNKYLNMIAEFNKYGYSLHTMGMGGSVNSENLLDISEKVGGSYHHADNDSEIEVNLDNVLQLSQSIKYAVPELNVIVYPGVTLENIELVAPPRNIDSIWKAGTYKVNLPDLISQSILVIDFDIKTDKGGNIGTKQDLVEWSMMNSNKETTSVFWENQNTVMMSGINTEPAIYSKVSEALKSLKSGDTISAQKAQKLLNNVKNNAVASSASQTITNIIKDGNNIGNLLDLVSNTRTDPSGHTINKRKKK